MHDKRGCRKWAVPRLNTSLNKSLVKLDIISHSSNILVGLVGGKLLQTLRPLEEYAVIVKKIIPLSGEIHSVFYIFDFFSSKQFRLILSLADNTLLLLRPLLFSSALKLIWQTASMWVTDEISHLGGALRPFVSSTVWALMDVVMAVRRRREKTWRSPNLWTLLFPADFQ